MTLILQEHFKSGSFSGFERQLYLYGFRKDSSYKEHSVYKHNAFTENSSLNITKIQGKQRIKKKESLTKGKAMEIKLASLKKDFQALKSNIDILRLQKEKEKVKSQEVLKSNNKLLDELREQKKKRKEHLKIVFSTIFDNIDAFKSGFRERVRQFVIKYNVPDVYKAKNYCFLDSRTDLSMLKQILTSNKVLRKEFFEFLSLKEGDLFSLSDKLSIKHMQKRATEDLSAPIEPVKEFKVVDSGIWERERDMGEGLIRDLSVLGEENDESSH